MPSKSSPLSGTSKLSVISPLCPLELFHDWAATLLQAWVHLSSRGGQWSGIAKWWDSPRPWLENPTVVGFKKTNLGHFKFPLRFSFVKWLPSSLWSKMAKKLKIKNVAKRTTFLTFSISIVLFRIRSKVAWEATLQRKTVKEMWGCQNLILSESLWIAFG